MTEPAATPAVPRQAATVVLLRDGATGAANCVEVYLLRRPSRSSFAANAHVFPGGAVDAADSDPALLALAPGFDPSAAAARMQLDADAEGLRLCAGLHVAAVREVLEEAGILIGSRGDGSGLEAGDAPRLASARAELLGGAALLGVLRDHDLRIAPQRLVYAAHFVTPEAEPRRYDTRFFLAVAPTAQEAAIHAGEATQGDWFAAAEILERHAGDLASLMPPTRIMCNEIARHDSAATVLEDLGGRPVERILFPLRAVLEGRVPELLPRPGEPAWW